MDYQQYMKKIEADLSSMDDIQIRASFRNFFRQISEEDREQTLIFFEKPIPINHKKELVDLQQWSSQVEDGEISLVYQYYEDYSRGYWNSERYSYEDPQGIGSALKKWFASAERWLYDRQYKDALAVYQIVLPLIFSAEDEDGGDTIELTLGELLAEGLVNLDLKRISGLAAYAAYKGTSVAERARAIYQLVESSPFSDFSLNYILSVGDEEILDLKEFLPLWKTYLRNVNATNAGKLLKEAALMQGDLLEEAKQSVHAHPELYVDVLQDFLKRSEYKNLFEEGHNAMKAMDPDWVLRGQVCRMTAFSALQLGKFRELVEAAWEAFRSDSSVGNYLFLCSLSQNEEILRERVIYRIEEIKPNKNLPAIRSHYSGSEKARNTLSETDYNILRFFLGKFEETFTLCATMKKPLGWSFNFVNTGVPLFMVLLYQDNALGTGMKTLVRGLTSDFQYKEEYGNKPFWDAFYTWKQSIRLKKEDEQKYYSYLKQTIEERIDAIVSEKHRGSYGKAALLAACLGELNESRGERFAKKRVMDSYHERFVKHRAFRDELKKLM